MFNFSWKTLFSTNKTNIVENNEAASQKLIPEFETALNEEATETKVEPIITPKELKDHPLISEIGMMLSLKGNNDENNILRTQLLRKISSMFGPENHETKLFSKEYKQTPEEIKQFCMEMLIDNYNQDFMNICIPVSHITPRNDKSEWFSSLFNRSSDVYGAGFESKLTSYKDVITDTIVQKSFSQILLKGKNVEEVDLDSFNYNYYEANVLFNFAYCLPKAVPVDTLDNFAYFAANAKDKTARFQSLDSFESFVRLCPNLLNSNSLHTYIKQGLLRESSDRRTGAIYDLINIVEKNQAFLDPTDPITIPAHFDETGGSSDAARIKRLFALNGLYGNVEQQTAELRKKLSLSLGK